MILVPEDNYGLPLSIHTEKVPVAIIWRHNDVFMKSESS